MDPKERALQVGDLNISILEEGDPDGFPIVVHHGTPSSALLYRQWCDDARSQGVRLIGYDRPGYGGSTRAPGRSVADTAAYVTAIADHLGLEKLATWGISGGGPHALACAALLPDRIVAAATLASVGAANVDDLDFTAGMGEDNEKEFAAARSGESELRPLLEAWRPGFLGGTTEALIAVMSTVLSDVDAAALSGEAAGFFLASGSRALRDGVDGWIDDDLAFVRAWGFELGSIRVPVLLRQGRQDLMVPWTHGEWLAARIPGVEARLEPEEGHLTLLLSRVRETQQWLLDHA